MSTPMFSCAVCTEPLDATQPCALLVLGDSPCPEKAPSWIASLAAGVIAPLRLCPVCDAAVLATLTQRRTLGASAQTPVH